MKRLFTAIFAVVLLVLGTPALLATIMYDGSGDEHMPVHLYTEDASAEAMLMEELRDSFDELETGVTDDFVLNIHEDILNVAIFEAIREENPEYMPTDDCSTPEQCYISAEQQTFEDFDLSLRVVGAWVDFKQDVFNLNVFLEVELEDGFTYKTIVSTEFEFLDVAGTSGEYVLDFQELRIGNLPIPSSALAGLINAIDSNINEVDLDSQIGEMAYGDLDLDDFKFTITKQEIAEMISEGDGEDAAQSALVEEVVSIVLNKIVVFEFANEEFIATGELSKFESEDVTDIPSYLYDLHTVDPVTGEIGEYDPESIDTETYLKNLFTEFVFNNALTGNSGFEINEEVFNKMIYASAEGFVEQRTIEEIDLGDGEIITVELGLQAMWFEITPEAISAQALIRLDSVDSLLNVEVTKNEEASTATELVFELTDITFGKDVDENANEYLAVLDLQAFKNLFAEQGDIGFGSFDDNGVLTISTDGLSALMQDGSEEGAVNVTGLSIIQDAIVLNIEPAGELATALADFSAALESVVESEELLTDLESVLDTTTEGPEKDVYDSVTDLQETLSNDEVPTAEEIEELFDNLEELDAETQEEFLDTIEALIDPAVLAAYQDGYEAETTPE